MSQYAEITNSPAIGGGELDKLTEFGAYTDSTMSKSWGGATGLQFMLYRNMKSKTMQISPRQFRCLNSKIDATGDTYLNVPFSMSYNGPLWDYEFTNTDFVAAGGQKTWTWNNPPQSLPLSSSSWQGNKLIIPRSFGQFENWLTWLYEGAMVMTGSLQAPESYGRVDRLYAPNDGSAIWADVTWISGTKPTSGNLYIPQHGCRKLFWGDNTRISSGGWQDPGFVSQKGTPADRNFPNGIK
jgi:hypothetical protein